MISTTHLVNSVPTILAGVLTVTVLLSVSVCDASLDTYAIVIGGLGNGSANQGCTRSGPPAEFSGYFGKPSIPSAGITQCGYSGGMSHISAAKGPVANNKSLVPVNLGNPGTSHFNGAAHASADYGRLNVSAHANISGGMPKTITDLHEASGAAQFSDTLTASSPLVPIGSAGFVRYQFTVAGNFNATGTTDAVLLGEVLAVLALQQHNGPIYRVFTAHGRRGELSSIFNATAPSGWTTDKGSLLGKSRFYSVELPITWGQAWDLKAGLYISADGMADIDISAVLTGLELFDAKHVPITQYRINSTSGVNYSAIAPAPVTQTMRPMFRESLGLLVDFFLSKPGLEQNRADVNYSGNTLLA
ncbi:MAG: hypothetical protein WC782_10015 [Methylococcaceae bacterium]|jgi:hypothetical protein